MDVESKDTLLAVIDAAAAQIQQQRQAATDAIQAMLDTALDRLQNEIGIGIESLRKLLDGATITIHPVNIGIPPIAIRLDLPKEKV